MHPFKVWWTFGLFLPFVIINKAAMNILCVSFGEHMSAYLVRIFLEWNCCIIRCACVQLHELLPNNFPKWCTNLYPKNIHINVVAHPCQQLVLSVYWNLAFLVYISYRVWTWILSHVYLTLQWNIMKKVNLWIFILIVKYYLFSLIMVFHRSWLLDLAGSSLVLSLYII
jgi:hypothetical protein